MPIKTNNQVSCLYLNSLCFFKKDTASYFHQRGNSHSVKISPWPTATALLLGSLMLETALFFRDELETTITKTVYIKQLLLELTYESVVSTSNIFYVEALFFILVTTIAFWFTDVTREGHREKQHTLLVQRGLRAGMFLFIVSEIMFFFSFFWSFFHFSLSPSIFIFTIWPPVGITAINPWKIPFLNTIILLVSGVFLTVSHRAMTCGFKRIAWHFLLWTLVLGLVFTLLQLFEYVHSSFSINDSVYGSIFFIATGFHGLHVVVGTIFLLVCYPRLRLQLWKNRHLGFECAIFYWHFVDVVWLFLFTAIYWWGY